MHQSVWKLRIMLPPIIPAMDIDENERTARSAISAAPCPDRHQVVPDGIGKSNTTAKARNNSTSAADAL